MKRKLTALFFAGMSMAAVAQTQITNAGFENWGNSAPGNADEPTSWYSNKTGSTVASIGPQTCYQETSNPHSGASCVRLETKYYIIAVVNGNLTTGVVNAPSQDKSVGYIGTVNYSTATDQRRMNFTGRPDSLVGWYRYTQATSGTGAALEKGKVVAFLHTGDFNDPEVPVSANHTDLSANKIGEALFLTEASNTATWKRFSVPFVYTNGSTPSYIMINATPSENQLTSAPGFTGTGSILWLDDLEMIYNSNASVAENTENNFDVSIVNNSITVDLKEKQASNAQLTMFDLTGKIVMKQSLKANELNVIPFNSSIQAGTYLYEVTGSSIWKTGKLNLN
jgi:hypothetical protein